MERCTTRRGRETQALLSTPSLALLSTPIQQPNLYYRPQALNPNTENLNTETETPAAIWVSGFSRFIMIFTPYFFCFFPMPSKKGTV
jgi:hypothetical protein